MNCENENNFKHSVKYDDHSTLNTIKIKMKKVFKPTKN